MPLYAYECEKCGTTFEKRQHFDDPPVQQCPQGHSQVRRVYQPAGIIFKGSGWYITDSRKSSGKSESTSEDK